MDYSCKLREAAKGGKPVALIETWRLTQGFPPEISSVFSRSRFASLEEMQLMVSVPDYIITCPQGSIQSRHDLFILAKSGEELSAITVEGQEGDSFGPTVGEWLNSGQGIKCVPTLHELLMIPQEATADIMYRLLFLAASTAVGARLFSANYAVFLIHAFHTGNQCFEEFSQFAAAFGKEAKKDELFHLHNVGDLQLFAGWATGRRKFRPTTAIHHC